MKKVLLAIVAFGMLTSCAGVKDHLPGQKQIAEERRQLSGFERIELLGSLDVKYMQADSFSVLVKAPEDVIDRVETRVDGNRLVVKMKGDGKFINVYTGNTRDVAVYVTSPDFLGIELKGSGDFECKRRLDTDTLQISLNGSGDIDFNDVICDLAEVSLIGSGDVEVKNLKARHSKIELVGSGDIDMKFDDSGLVESRLLGSGDIKLAGTVSDFRSHVRGSGDMKTHGLTIRK